MHTYTDRQIAAFSELISLIHSEMLTLGVWRKILDLINTIVPSDYSVVMFLDSDTGAPTGWVHRNMDQSFFDSYVLQYKDIETVMPAALASGLSVWRPEDVIGDRKWRGTAVYQDLSRNHGVRNNVTMAVTRATDLALWVRLLRTTATAPFTDKEVEILRLIQTHIAAAVKRFEGLGEADFLMKAIMPSIKKTSKPCFTLNHKGDLMHMSESAKKLCEAVEDKQAVLSALSQTASVLLNNMPGFRAPVDDQPERLFFIASKMHGLVFCPFQLPGFRAQFLMFVSDVGASMLAICERTMTVAGFSVKESEVGRMLIRGLSNSEIAEKMQVTVLTIKDHIKSIREKIGVSNRSQVLMKLLGF